ncbi:MAG: selenide, water dikinase SelD [Nitrospirae bacterium GWF2_44_13]|nr:MAG: selenide, water dikinase SelD [Nitrospirae bacterium GWF2_44_13]OGW35819.1 MAG: selenide, water dikinase SelD [Nitrospirae bacterium GWD2_44_7]OGW64122.1 MAG: selenide, water dikinase SelD [Nitrospirae bacterium RIFOXYA2_FULL_44_9]
MLGQLPDITDPNVLVGHANSDDAGVYRITDDIVVVLTADFFTPIVDDPYWFGAIAAANALSDVYAMGGKPLVSLNIAMFPNNPEFFPSLKKIMQGGIDKMSEAGVSIIGGHTIRDKEPKYGFAVMGVIHPAKILDNSKAQAGDALILTKKIGTGIIATGVKAGKCSDAVIEEFTASMAALNKRASEIMLEIGVSTATDITGFGLIGHLHEVLSASKCRAQIYSGRVPYFEGAIRLADAGVVPGGTKTNIKNYEPYVTWGKGVPEVEKILMNDAQTSGGLLIFVPSEKKDKLINALEKENIIAAHIGDVTDKPFEDGKRIHVGK